MEIQTRQMQWNIVTTELAICICFTPCSQGGDDNISTAVSEGGNGGLSASLHLIVYFAIFYTSYSAKLVFICNES